MLTRKYITNEKFKVRLPSCAITLSENTQSEPFTWSLCPYATLIFLNENNNLTTFLSKQITLKFIIYWKTQEKLSTGLLS